MSVCIYTANAGGYDALRAGVEQDIEVDWLYYTDDLLVMDEQWVRLDVRTDLTPMYAAKWHKTHPPTGYDHAIWIDANMAITSPRFAREAVAALGRAPLAVWQHPRRDCVYDEAEATVGAERQGCKYDPVTLAAQTASYRAEGYPAHNGLYANGTVVWTQEALVLGAEWYDECRRWTPQDQVSLPVVCWRAGVKPATFPKHQTPRRFDRLHHRFRNEWLDIYAHVVRP